MNNANKAARARMAVDVVSSTRLLLKLAASRYQEQKDMAWTWEEDLTPHGKKLWDTAFETLNYRDYSISIKSDDDRWRCRVTRLGRGHIERRCWFMKEEGEDGSIFCGCSYGVPNMDGLPCHHMIAVVKCGWIEGLTPTNTMPNWWTTECWKRQYPAETDVTCNFNLDTLRRTPEDMAMRYCPPYTAGKRQDTQRMISKWKVQQKGQKREGTVTHKKRQSRREGGAGSRYLGSIWYYSERIKK